MKMQLFSKMKYHMKVHLRSLLSLKNFKYLFLLKSELYINDNKKHFIIKDILCHT